MLAWPNLLQGLQCDRLCLPLSATERSSIAFFALYYRANHARRDSTQRRICRSGIVMQWRSRVNWRPTSHGTEYLDVKYNGGIHSRHKEWNLLYLGSWINCFLINCPTNYKWYRGILEIPSTSYFQVSLLSRHSTLADKDCLLWDRTRRWRLWCLFNGWKDVIFRIISDGESDLGIPVPSLLIQAKALYLYTISKESIRTTSKLRG